MCRIRLLAAAVFAAAAWGQAPSYTSAGIVNASDYSPGPFAPGSVIALFGSNLSWATYTLQASDIQAGSFPPELNGITVIVDGNQAPIFYVSPTQVNFMIPTNDAVGPLTVQVVREGQSGPVVTLQVAAAAPCLFVWGNNLALATHADYSLVSPTAPAQPGEIIVLFATGLGKTSPDPGPLEIPAYPAPLVGSIQVTLAGQKVDPSLIKYAGITPGSAGLYQINLAIPPGTAANPAILVTVAGQTSSAGLVLPVQ